MGKKKFSTTIKQMYWTMKMEDCQRQGYFYEFKENNKHWARRLRDLQKHTPTSGTFLVGSEPHKVTVTDIVLIPVLLVLLRHVAPIVLRVETINRLYQWNVVRTVKRYEKYRKWEELGLALFVAIPLPFTGVYSGTLVSYVLDFRKREAFLSIASGAVMAGIIVTALSIGILG